jgi:lipopolysaccharide/colanic/teichoic acid biosynthesis glycosyltransferase
MFLLLQSTTHKLLAMRRKGMSEEFSVEAKPFSRLIERKEKVAEDLSSKFRYRVIKRTADFLLVTITLPIWLPICVLLALVVRCSSLGPIFYCEYRLGQYGKPFRIWKFRSMYVKEEQERRMREAECTSLDHSRLHKHRNDPRVTPIGRSLRRWSLDELPQLLNVLRGEMALIGPRPIVEAERPLYGHGFRYYCVVRPGLSGLWQVSGRSRLGHGERVLLDCRYVRDWSLIMDVRILLKTFQVVVTARGAC